jgi:hypothetical protein
MSSVLPGFCSENYPNAKLPITASKRFTERAERGDTNRAATHRIESPDVEKCVVNGAFLRPALVLFEIGLKLSFGLVGVGNKFLARAKG